MSTPDGGAPLAAHPELLVEDVLGRGGSATVYRALEVSTGRRLAWKVWDAPLDAAGRERFDAECTVHAALSEHPRIVRLLGRAVPADGERPWISTVLHEGSLDRVLAEHGTTLSGWRTLAEDLLTGLAAVHAGGYVHRDVKPANVLLAQERWALGDLGTAHGVDVRSGDGAAGTAMFLAPELGRPGAAPTPRSDVYSAATTLLVALDHLPAGAEVPAALEGLLTRAASAHPDDRPADAREFLERLRAGLPEPTPTLPSKRSRRSVARTVVTGVVALGLVVGAVGVGYRVSQSDTAAGTATCERLPQPDPLTIPDGSVLSGVGVDGYVTSGHISIEVAGRIAPHGNAPAGSSTWFLAVPSTDSLGMDGRPGSGRWYPLGEVEPDADGCFLTVPLLLSSYDAAQGIEYDVHLAVLSADRTEQARGLLAENSSEGLDNMPGGVELLDSFDLPTAGFDRL